MKILIIEDSERLRRSLAQGLEKIGYSIDSAEDGEKGLNMAMAMEYNVIVLDLMLPKLDGLSVLKSLRAKGNEANILILSAKDQVNDRVKGLEMGADDYLVKPFAFNELCSRIKAICRRHYNLKDPVVRIGNVEIDTQLKQVSSNKTDILLTASEYSLLECLVYQRGRTLSKNQLMNWLYDIDSDISSNVVEVVIGSIRRKFKKSGADNIIMTRRGFGYMIR